jgi:TPR repeat protein
VGCVGLAEMYISGTVPAPNDSSARVMLRTACIDQREASGCLQLARAHESGRGAPQDFGRAASYYRRACDGRIGEGCYNLALAYERGAGVFRSTQEAAQYRERACNLGFTPACARPKGT